LGHYFRQRTAVEYDPYLKIFYFHIEVLSWDLGTDSTDHAVKLVFEPLMMARQIWMDLNIADLYPR
jgi:hypothetical protein